MTSESQEDTTLLETTYKAGSGGGGGEHTDFSLLPAFQGHSSDCIG